MSYRWFVEDFFEVSGLERTAFNVEQLVGPPPVEYLVAVVHALYRLVGLRFLAVLLLLKDLELNEKDYGL